MNLNLKLDSSSIGPLIKKLVGQIHILILLVFMGMLAYSVYFATNLFYAKSDLDAVANRQTNERTKQIRFNEKTLESLDRLLPPRPESAPTNNGRSNPFAPL